MPYPAAAPVIPMTLPIPLRQTKINGHEPEKHKDLDQIIQSVCSQADDPAMEPSLATPAFSAPPTFSVPPMFSAPPPLRGYASPEKRKDVGDLNSGQTFGAGTDSLPLGRPELSIVDVTADFNGTADLDGADSVCVLQHDPEHMHDLIDANDFEDEIRTIDELPPFRYREQIAWCV
jgi:hypothetical protein